MRRNTSHNPIANIVPPATLTMLGLAIVIGTLIWAMGDHRASAHEGRSIGEYYFDVGFINEPAYEGHLNGVALRVSRIVGSESHSSDDHDHDDEMSAPDRDVTVHGAHFHTPGINRGTNYEYVIPHGMEDLNIPYHTHPDPFEGEIAVLEGTGTGENYEVIITPDGLEPKYVEVNVGDTVTWVNSTGAIASVMSGPHSSMTQEILTETMNMAQTTVTTGPPVTGLSGTLQVEVTHVPSGASIQLSLVESDTEPGYYVAPFIPTATGEYTFRFTGDVGELAVDDSFTSGPGTFDAVVPSDQIEFPDSIRSAREIENAVSGARDNAAAAAQEAQEAAAEAERGSNSANIALGLGIVALLAGLAGAVLGGLAFMATRARQE